MTCEKEKKFDLYENQFWEQYIDKCNTTKVIRIVEQPKIVDSKAYIYIERLRPQNDLRMDFMYINEVHFNDNDTCSRKYFGTCMDRNFLINHTHLFLGSFNQLYNDSCEKSLHERGNIQRRMCDL